MPIYDYRCPECDHKFEARHGFDDPAPACPNCEHEEVTRLITQAPTVARGLLSHAGDGHRASKDQLRDKWAEETPRLRKKLRDKLGDDAVNSIPSLNTSYD
jgi:putative FmdB family regulatory protein